MHVVLHSHRALGDWSLLHHRRKVRETLRLCADRNGVKICDFANVGSHLHLLVQVRRREAFQAFLRSFAGIVARVVTGARRGRPARGGGFWSALAWSRVVQWGRDYRQVLHYVFRNRIEASDGIAIRRALERGPPAFAAADARSRRSGVRRIGPEIGFSRLGTDEIGGARFDDPERSGYRPVRPRESPIDSVPTR
jgi:REP element-mobilizing transposase RayT